MASAQLTDEELFSELKGFGFVPGPITENTRPVYLKKLKKLREEQQQRGSRFGKTRNSGNINNNSGGSGNSSNTAAGAAGPKARPPSNDVTHLSPSRSSGGRSTPTEKRSSGGGKFVLGFSSDESDTEVALKKGGPNHNSRRDRGSSCQRQQTRPTGTPTSVRRSSAVNSSSPALLDTLRRSPGSPRWNDRDKPTVRARSIVTDGRAYDEPDEDDDDEYEASQRDTRALNGSRASITLHTSKLPGDYSDSDEEKEEASEKELQKQRWLSSTRSHSKASHSVHKTLGGSPSSLSKMAVGIRVNDPPDARSLDRARGKPDETTGESSIGSSLLNRHYYRGPVRASGVSMDEGPNEGSNNSSSAYLKNHIDGVDTGSTSSSGFTPGLKQRYPSHNSFSSTYRPNHSNHTGSNHSYSHTTHKQKVPVPEDELLQQFKREEVSPTGGFSAHYLSMFLLIAACLFFVLIGLMYLRMRGSGTSDVDIVIRNHPFGERFDELYTNKEKTTILNLLLHLHDHLARIAGEYDCGDQEEVSNRSLSMSDAEAYLKLQSPDYKDLVVSALEWIIWTEEDVGIRLIGDSPEVTVTEVSEISRLESTHPKMSFLCRFRRAFFTVVLRVLLVFAGIGTVWGLLKYLKYRWRREEEETRQMYDMVERIIDVLRSHSEACHENKDLQPYLPIPHVRDALIQPPDRKKMKKVWERAVKFLDANESRIRTESQRVDGADKQVWKWLQPVLSCDKMSMMPSKVWQGKAFPLDKRNSPPNSLTPCLKIRNMFDPVMEVGDNWHLAIQEAILEKCSDNDGIVHIAVDKNSREGCVYVKCLSAEHSGKAFKALHGSWFDGKLVTVKYLRLDRYHQRFPQASGCMTPLKPSNTHFDMGSSSSSGLRHRSSAAHT